MAFKIYWQYVCESGSKLCSYIFNCLWLNIFVQLILDNFSFPYTFSNKEDDVSGKCWFITKMTLENCSWALNLSQHSILESCVEWFLFFHILRRVVMLAFLLTADYGYVSLFTIIGFTPDLVNIRHLIRHFLWGHTPHVPDYFLVR
jgi:hypothetical protein